MEKQISCPHCKTDILFKKNSEGKLAGTIVGGGIGYGVATGLGIAGAIAGMSIAIPATLVGIAVFAILGNNIGKGYDNSQAKCPKCRKNLIL